MQNISKLIFIFYHTIDATVIIYANVFLCVWCLILIMVIIKIKSISLYFLMINNPYSC